VISNSLIKLRLVGLCLGAGPSEIDK